MKTKKILKEYAGTPLAHLPEDLQEQLKTDPNLQAELEQQARVAELMGLKQYEVPDEAMFGRVHYRTHLQITHQQHAPQPSFFTQWPTWARVTAVVAFMLGLSVLTHREMLRTEQEDPVIAAPAPAPESLETLPPMFLSESDPFDPFTYDPSRDGLTEFPSALTRKLEADFEALGLTEINRLEPPTRLPVRLQTGR